MYPTHSTLEGSDDVDGSEEVVLVCTTLSEVVDATPVSPIA